VNSTRYVNNGVQYKDASKEDSVLDIFILAELEYSEKLLVIRQNCSMLINVPVLAFK
jgi:hypothetical protein